jgi:glutaredoxin 3
MKVTVYSTPTCGYCHQAKQFLSERGVKYTDIDVSKDREAAEQMVNLTGQMGVPVIVIDGEVIVGFNRPRIEQLIANGGNGKHASFGLSIADASTVARKSGRTPVFGAFVGKVKPALYGEKAGLRPGDIITELNKKTIRNADDLEKVLSSLTGGSRVAITFIRDDTRRQTEILI